MRQYNVVSLHDDDGPWGPILDILDDPTDDGRGRRLVEREAR